MVLSILSYFEHYDERLDHLGAQPLEYVARPARASVVGTTVIARQGHRFDGRARDRWIGLVLRRGTTSRPPGDD
jgi:hypothetical protein